MATGQSIINRALRLIGVIASGEGPTAQESADALEALNQMIDSWRTDRLTVYAYQLEALPLTSGIGTYTIGPSGTLVTTRPERIVEAFVRVGNADTPVTIFTASQWNALPNKSLQDSLPECIYYEGTMPDGTLQCFPVPGTSASLQLMTWVPLAAVDLATTIALPPGYERAIIYNFAIEIAPEYERDVSNAVARVATDSLAAIKRANQRPIESWKDLDGGFNDDTTAATRL